MRTSGRLILLVLALAMLTAVACASDGSSFVYDGYTYDFYGNAKSTPLPYQLSMVLSADLLGGIPLESVDDVCSARDGRIFIADAKQSRVHVLSEKGDMPKSLKLIRGTDNKIVLNPDGSQLSLSGCQGLFYHEKEQELYIADTGAMRVVVLDGQSYAFKRTILKPKNLTGESEFRPSKVVVDTADRIYLVVQSSYEGIIELNSDGSFSRYFGVNEPSVNLLDYFWKSIATDQQKQKMSKTYAPAFNNVALDGEGFVMAVTFDSAASQKVFRLNFAGANVLREGVYPVVGDRYAQARTPSAFVDIAVTDYGSYALLDRSRGRIFLYNFDGDLLCAFGSLGNLKGQFKAPSGIAFLGDRLLVADSTLKCVYVFNPTDFGTALLRANEAYYRGDWAQATRHYEQVLRLCGNMEVAYTGIGKSYLMQDDYDQAMYYFRLGNSREPYSKAYQGHRNIQLRDHFGVIALLVVGLVSVLVITEWRYHKKLRRQKG